MSECTIAMMQLRVIPNNLEKNLQNMKLALSKVVNADIAVFPECCDVGWAAARSAEFAQPVPGGATVRFIQQLAAEFHIYIVAGLTEKDGERIYNTAVFISDTGEFLGKHRKINLVPDVEKMYAVGDRIQVFHTPMGTIGIDICADNLIPSVMIGESMAKMGAKLILAPSSWAVPMEKLGKEYGQEWIEPFEYLSRKYDLDILAVSNVGPVTDGEWKGWTCIGNSIAIGEQGKKAVVLNYGPDAEEIRYYHCGARGAVAKA